MDDHNHPLPEASNYFPTHESLKAEQAVLGAILLEPKEAMDEVTSKLKGNEFIPSPPIHRRIYKAMLELYEEEKPIDLVTLTTRLMDKGWLEDDGVSYLSKLAGVVPTAANVGYYIAIVQEKHMQRQLVSDFEELLNQAQTSSESAKLIASAQARMEQLVDQSQPKKAYRPLRDILIDCMEDLEHRYRHQQDGGTVTGVTSGFPDLDRMTAGWQKSDFIVIGARPSVGKTAFALNIARHAAQYKFIEPSTIEPGQTVAIFSLEMSEKQLVNRMLCAESNVDAGRIRTGSLQGDDWEKISMGIGNLSELPIVIDDTPAITVTEIRAKCRKIKKEKGLGLILIDYLQLVTGRSRPGVNRQEEVSEISRTFKQIARELEVPVIALSQLSRGVEQRQDKRPMMSDLRDSGSLEQDADIVAFLYRDDYYDKETQKKNITEVIISKQRNGPTGTVELVFIKNLNKFLSLDRSHADVMTSQPTEPPTEPRTRNIPDMHNWKNKRR